MSVEKLRERIRKTKNPSMIDLSITTDQIPDSILAEQESAVAAIHVYGKLVLAALKNVVPAVRLSYGYFSCLGQRGLDVFYDLLQTAKAYGFYVVVDVSELSSVRLCRFAAEFFMNLSCDGVIISGYAGSDVIKPYAEYIEDSKKSLFVTLRHANRSASQLQDLVTGSRLVHIAAADTVKRLAEGAMTRSGYSQIGGVASATAADSLRTLRSKHPNLYLLVDGYDYSNANAKNCSYAFDKFGYGAVVCACDSILSAWKEDPMTDLSDCIAAAAERMKKNLTRYVSIL